jgi:hypothetical protein
MLFTDQMEGCMKGRKNEEKYKGRNKGTDRGIEGGSILI